MPIVQILISDEIVNPTFNKPDCINDIFKKKFYDFDYSELLNVLINTLSKMNYISQGVVHRQTIAFHEKIALNILGKGYQNKYNIDYSPIIVTRNNILLILKKLLSEDSQSFSSKRKISRIEQLSYYLLKINLFQDEIDKDKELSPDFANKKEGLLLFLFSTFRQNYFNQSSHLSLSEMIRNYNLLTEIVKSKQGIEANRLFEKSEGVSVIKSFDSIFIAYLFLYSKHINNIYHNIIYLDNDFVEFGDAADKIKKAISDYFENIIVKKKYVFSNNESLYNQFYFWKTPILKLGPNIYQIIDIGILIEKTFINSFLYFESEFLSDNTKKDKKETNLELRREVLSKYFEKYIENILFSKLNLQRIDNMTSQDDELGDHLLISDDKMLLIEDKAGYLAIGKIINNLNEKNIEDLIVNKIGINYPGFAEYQSLKKGEKKGIRQIIHTFSKISQSKILNSDIDLKIKNINSMYGIVIVQDNKYSVPFLNRLIYISNIDYIQNISNKTNYNVPFIVHINDFSKILNGNIDLFEAIDSYTTETDYLITFQEHLNNKYDFPIEITDEEYKEFVDNKILNKYIKIPSNRNITKT